MLRTATHDFGEVMNKKVSLVSEGKLSRSLREFGGLYLVLGKYLLEPAISLKADYASMVDVTPRPEWQKNIDNALEQLPRLKVDFVQGDFREPQLLTSLRPVDTSILFEVLLHQENYLEVMRQACRLSNKYVCIAQPCLKEDEFKLPASATLLQFWPPELKMTYRQGSFWPEEPTTERFDTRYWMWGHTTSHLIAFMHGVGWVPEYAEVVDDVCGPKWEYALLRFRRGG